MQKTALIRHCLTKDTAFCTRTAYWRHRYITKTLLVMKLTFILLTVTFLNVAASGLSQSVTISGIDMPLDKIFNEVKKQTGYLFFYHESVTSKSKTCDCRCKK